MKMAIVAQTFNCPMAGGWSKVAHSAAKRNEDYLRQPQQQLHYNTIA
jgi:hypothetical protein